DFLFICFNTLYFFFFFFFFSSRRRHTRSDRDWSSDVCSSDLPIYAVQGHVIYNFDKGFWVGLDGTYYEGGETSINGVEDDNRQRSEERRVGKECRSGRWRKQ